MSLENRQNEEIALDAGKMVAVATRALLLLRPHDLGSYAETAARVASSRASPPKISLDKKSQRLVGLICLVKVFLDHADAKLRDANKVLVSIQSQLHACAF